MHNLPGGMKAARSPLPTRLVQMLYECRHSLCHILPFSAAVLLGHILERCDAEPVSGPWPMYKLLARFVVKHHRDRAVVGPANLGEERMREGDLVVLEAVRTDIFTLREVA